MSGHSKWASIKRKKAVTDQKKGKVFSKLARAITVAAKYDKNLDMAIDAAKAVNMPKENIERAIKKGQGELGNSVQIEEIEYEAYGPEGIALIVRVLTDNRNRSVSGIRALLNKVDGQLASNGSVKFLFDFLGVCEINGQLTDEEQLSIIELGAKDIIEDNKQVSVQSDPKDLAKIKNALLRLEKKVVSASLQYVPKINKELDDESKEKVLKFLEAIDDLDDVDEIFTNADL